MNALIRDKSILRLLLFAILTLATPVAMADEGGVSFWLPGNFGSFAAAPGEPGWAMPLIYYHSSTDAGGGKSFPLSGRITAGLHAHADFAFAAPTYTFATPVAGGQAAFSMAEAYGPLKARIDATLTGPNGSQVSGTQSDSRSAFSDLFPMATLKWNRGLHNLMVYTMGDIPVGAYNPDRLANQSLNHWAVDGGGGYTYFDKKNELSAALGFTYNWENPDTKYRNGESAHLDLAASRFLSPTVHAGIVGYIYNQLSGDSGEGAKLGDFKSKVAGIGPEIGWFFVAGEKKWYASVKGYYEFDARNRPKGFNVWVILAVPLSSPHGK